MNKGDLTLEAALSLFLMNRDSRNYSPKTVRWYSDMLGRFAEWFGADEKIASIDANAIREYARSVRDRDLSKFTRHAYMRTLKTFLRWL
ncbi:MAG: site-specific integrase, partial [Chloroflexi bacterium]|nr:site-specific integrase [Chloroflexota bacterium]